MGSLVRIMDWKVTPLFYRKRPVVTLNQVDELHGRRPDTARKSFNRNRSRMIEGKHFFNVPYDEYSALTVHNKDGQSPNDFLTRHIMPSQSSVLNTRSKGGSRVDMVFLTETGYVMVIKPFNDDLSWAIMSELIDFYFKKKEPPKPISAEEVEGFKADLPGLGTTGTARKYGRSTSTIKKYTVTERAAMAGQLPLFS